MAKSGKTLGFLRLLLFLLVVACLLLAVTFLPEPRIPAPAQAVHRSLVQFRVRLFDHGPRPLARKADDSVVPGQSGSAPVKPARTVSLADSRYFAGMPQPGRGFPFSIKVLENIGYTAGYCPQRRMSVWVAYRVFKVHNYQGPPLAEKFAPDLRVSSPAVPADYTGSGYDRGFLAPNYAIAVCYGHQAQLQTFLMTNIVPQRPQLNREVWEELERLEVKDWPTRYGEVWVIAGPIFGTADKRLKGGEAVPRACYKIVVREEGIAPKVLAFIMPQTVSGTERPEQFLVSVNEVERETNLDFFRALPDDEEERLEAETPRALW